MDTILLKPKSKQELELLKAMAKKMGIKFSTLSKKEQEKIGLVKGRNPAPPPQKLKKKVSKKAENESSFVPGNPEKAKEAMQAVFGMWADRKDMEDINEWRRKLWERES